MVASLLIDSWISIDLFKPSAFKRFLEANEDTVSDLRHQIPNPPSASNWSRHDFANENWQPNGQETTGTSGFAAHLDILAYYS